LSSKQRTFRPSILARELSDYPVVNVGAAGTFVVRKPGPRGKFRAELLRTLPFEAEVVLCDGRHLICLEMENPFGTEPSRPDIVRFVSILSKAGHCLASIPRTLPPREEWFVRVIVSKSRFVFGVYRRHMKNDRRSWPDRQSVRCTGDDTELEHDNRHRAVFEKPSSPTSIAIHPSGKLAYVTNSGSNNVSMYSVDVATEALTLIGTIGT